MFYVKGTNRFFFDVTGRETWRSYGNGVRQETKYDRAGRVILIKETDGSGRIIRAEGYLYDEAGRRSHSVDEGGRVTKYEYDNRSRLKTVLYPYGVEKAEADRKEAEEAGLYFTPERGVGEWYMLGSGEQSGLREVLNQAGVNLGALVTANQLMWRESYSYDLNGNRISKSTPWGTIEYDYDAENRLLQKGDVVYTYDRDGNLLSEEGLRHNAMYEYNGQNRMVFSQVTDQINRTRATSEYAYDALGRRTVVQDSGGTGMRTLYDGISFQEIREGETFTDGSLTTRYGTGGNTNLGTEGSRYRWIGEGENGTRTRSTGEYSMVTARWTGASVTLYGKGEAVAVSAGSRAVYLGKDQMGSVRSATDGYGVLDDRYEYDAFGVPYTGDLTQGMNLGYTGKPYDAATGLYNYGYRDYAPSVARFTTMDPVRDGVNWFTYVNNDPVNYVDLWGQEDQKIEFQMEVEISIDIIRHTDWGKAEGRFIVDELQRMNEAGLIILDYETSYLSYYEPDTGKIGISPRVSGNEYEGTLVHEGKHRMDHIIGLPYTIESEYRAFDAQNRVNEELGYNIPSVSREEIDSRYPNLLGQREYQKSSTDGSNKTH